MNAHSPITAAVEVHPADELRSVRDQIKDLTKREDALKKAIRADRELRVGTGVHAIVSERARSTVDWKALALSLGATPAQIADHTKDAPYEVVELAELPDLAEVLHKLLNSVLVVVDCETTGFSHAAGDRIVSIGAQTVFVQDDGVVRVTRGAWMHEDVNPGRPSSPSAARVHGLPDDYLATKPPFVASAPLLRSVLEKTVIVAHNAPFDIDFLNAEFERCGMKPIANPVIDTRVLSKLLWPGEPASLDAMAERLGVDRGGRDERHDALEDCRVLAACLPGIVKLPKERV